MMLDKEMWESNEGVQIEVVEVCGTQGDILTSW